MARIFQEEKINKVEYIIAAQKVWNGWKPILHRLESNIGVANKWSKSISIVANIIILATRQLLFQNSFANTNGNKKWNT